MSEQVTSVSFLTLIRDLRDISSSSISSIIESAIAAHDLFDYWCLIPIFLFCTFLFVLFCCSFGANFSLVIFLCFKLDSKLYSGFGFLSRIFFANIFLFQVCFLFLIVFNYFSKLRFKLILSTQFSQFIFIQTRFSFISLWLTCASKAKSDLSLLMSNCNHDDVLSSKKFDKIFEDLKWFQIILFFFV